MKSNNVQIYIYIYIYINIAVMHRLKKVELLEDACYFICLGFRF